MLISCKYFHHGHHHFNIIFLPNSSESSQRNSLYLLDPGTKHYYGVCQWQLSQALSLENSASTCLISLSDSIESERTGSLH